MLGQQFQSKRALVWRYTLQYLFAMSLIVCAIIIGAFQIGHALEVNRIQGEVIKTAGAQQNLAQQLVLLPDRVAIETNTYKTTRYFTAIRETMEKMRAGHDFLMTGNQKATPPAQATPELEVLYNRTIDRALNRLLTAYDAYLSDPTANRAGVDVERVNAENFLFYSLDLAAELHTQDSENKIADAIALHQFWVIISLLLIILVVVFVFRPLAKDAGTTVAKMRAEIDVSASLLSRSFRVAKMGYWRAESSAARQLWLSKELIDLLDLELNEGFHPRSILQADEGDAKERNLHDAITRTWSTGRNSIFRAQFTKPNGQIIDMLIHMEPERNLKGEVIGIVGVIKDDTSEAESGRALLKSYKVIERKSSALLEAQNLGKLGTWRQPLGRNKSEWDDSVYELMGLSRETFVTTIENIQSRYVDDARDLIVETHRKVIKTGKPQSLTIQTRHGDGSLIDIHLRCKLQKDEDGNPIALFGTVQDVTSERSAARELEKLAYFDELTGLANRTLFTRELQRVSDAAAKTEQQSALLLIDLDHFKEVNDSLGHQAGDQLLGIVARRLTKSISSDGFVARLGGDEFAVIIEGYESIEALDDLYRNILIALSQPATLTLGVVQTNASIGIALAPLHSAAPNELLRFADLALYSSKENGRGQACYYEPSYSDILENRVSMSSKVRQALENNGFEVHFQPMVAMETGKVTCFEALVRLPKEDGGFIPPSEFIPIAESSHLIADLGSFVLHEACKEAQSWIDSGLPERCISVNISAAQLWHGDLESVIDQALNASGLDPRLLCIELTESVFVDDYIGRLEGILTRLKARGIQLALDDFGTGYSSLGYLNRLPFDSLKIDRSFITNADVNVEKRKLLQGVVNLGKGLELKITAEGVETQDELNLVRELGCDEVQGWFYSKALPGHHAVVQASRIDSLQNLDSALVEDINSNDSRSTTKPKRATR